MTKREFFTLIKNNAIFNDADMAQEVHDFCDAAIATLDNTNAKRKDKPSKTAIANEPIKKAIAEFLNGKEFTVASEIGKGCEITTNKASALCRQMVEASVLVVTDVKVKGKGVQKAYKLAE